MKIEVDDSRARAAFKAAPQTMTTILGQYLDRAAGVLAQTARQEESPKGSSTELSNSIKPRQLGPLEYLVSPGVDYAPYVHSGRKPGKLPFKYEKDDKGNVKFDEESSFYQWVKSIAVGRRRSRSKSGQKELRDAVFLIGHAIAKRGIQPNPFMGRTFARERSRVEKLMRDGIEAGIKAVLA